MQSCESSRQQRLLRLSKVSSFFVVGWCIEKTRHRFCSCRGSGDLIRPVFDQQRIYARKRTRGEFHCQRPGHYALHLRSITSPPLHITMMGKVQECWERSVRLYICRRDCAQLRRGSPTTGKKLAESGHLCQNLVNSVPDSAGFLTSDENPKYPRCLMCFCEVIGFSLFREVVHKGGGRALLCWLQVECFRPERVRRGGNAPRQAEVARGGAVTRSKRTPSSIHPTHTTLSSSVKTPHT